MAPQLASQVVCGDSIPQESSASHLSCGTSDVRHPSPVQDVGLSCECSPVQGAVTVNDLSSVTSCVQDEALLLSCGLQEPQSTCGNLVAQEPQGPQR